jgi:hypothetical protein
MVAQAGEMKEERKKEKVVGILEAEWEYLGLNAVEWIAVGYAVILTAGLLYVFWPKGEKGREEVQGPLCP